MTNLGLGMPRRPQGALDGRDSLCRARPQGLVEHDPAMKRGSGVSHEPFP